MFKCILVAIDNSERTGRVMEIARHLAHTTSAAVHIVHADEAEAVYDQVVDLEDDLAAQRLVDEEVARLRSAGIVATGDVMEVLHEDVADLILTRAHDFGTDLIILAPRHHSRFAALLHSSVSLEVTLKSPISILLVT